MKKVYSIVFLTLLVYTFHLASSTVLAACTWALNPAGGATSCGTLSAGSVCATTCGVDTASSEYYDYSAAADDAANGYNVAIPSGVTVTVNAGTSAVAKTNLGVGKFTLTGGGTLAVSANYINVAIGPKCYVYDGDSDKYSPTPTTCSTTGGAGYIRKNKLLGTGVDCGDGNASANPSQTTPSSASFTNTVTGLSYDWNCNGVQTASYGVASYSCFGCTNSSGYGSTQNTTSGFSGSVPACGAAGTYYTVTNGTCANPAVGGCAGYYSTSSVAQTCL